MSVSKVAIMELNFLDW